MCRCRCCPSCEMWTILMRCKERKKKRISIAREGTPTLNTSKKGEQNKIGTVNQRTQIVKQGRDPRTRITTTEGSTEEQKPSSKLLGLESEQSRRQARALQNSKRKENGSEAETNIAAWKLQM